MQYGFGDYRLDLQRYELRGADGVIPLDRQEFAVLAYLIAHRVRVVLRQELFERLWADRFVSDAALEQCIAGIRRAVGDSGRRQQVIQTVHGRGYRFIAPVAVQPGTDEEAPPLGEPPMPVAAPRLDPQDAVATPPLIPPVPPTSLLPAPATASGPSAARPDSPAAEWRQVTVMFCDLVGSTALAGQLDPEDLCEVLQAYRETCATVIARFGGNLDQFLGDGALVCFGYPQAHEDAPQRAVRAGLGIVEAMTRVNTRLGQTWGVQLAVRIGIHTGLVVAGALGMGETRDPLAIVGETPNLAARLQELAAPNTVVCSAATARLVEGYFTLDALGPQVLKGVTTPVPLYRVVGESAARTRLEAATRGLTPLVGREPELVLLLERWAAVKEGRGQVVALSGEAGIGKSRLVQAFTVHLGGEASTRIAYYCSPYYQQSALYPVIDHLHRLLQWRTEDPPAERLRKLEAALRSYDFALEDVVPLLAALLGLPLPEHYPPLLLTPQQQKQKTLETLLAWLLQEAERHPVCVVMEDLHWGDPSTLEWLSLLLTQIPMTRVLLLLLFRLEFQPPWAGRSYLTPLTLSRLSARETEGVIGHVTGGKRLPAAVVQHLVATTDGVPLFIEELTKVVLESGLVTEREDQYALVGPLSQLTIPTTLHDSLMARLDRLGSAKQVAQLGATVGREFSYEVIQAVAQVDAATLQQELAQLVDAELLYQRGLPPQARYTFKHALIHETAYQSMLKRTRRQYHRQVVQVWETRFPETVQTHPELLAHHYTAAGMKQEAIAYWQKASQRAVERSANLEAVQHLTMALSLLVTLPETPARVQQELDLQIALGPVVIATRGQAAPEVEQTYARARALCGQVGETPHLFPTLRGLCRFYQGRGALQTARELGEQLLRLAEREAAPTPRLEAHDTLGSSLFYLGDYAAAWTHLEQGIALTDQAAQRDLVFRHDVAPGVRCLAVGAPTLWCLGYPTQALRRSQEALALAQELAHSQSLTFVRHWTAYLHHRRREVRAVQAQADALLTLTAAQRWPLYEGLGTIWRGWVLALQGQREVGLAQLHQGLAAALATGQTLARPLCLILLAEVAQHTGRAVEGLHLVANAQVAFEANERGDLLAETYRLQGEFLLRHATSEVAQAAACFQQALTLARRQQAKAWELRAAMSLARLWQQQGKRAEAHELLAPVYHWFTEGFDTADLQEAKALLETLAG